MKKLRQRGIWLLVVAVLIAFVVIFAYPQAKALSLQSKAGKLIANYLTQAQKEQPAMVEGNFYCVLPTLYPSLPNMTKLDQAILSLNKAKSLVPNDTYTNFMLGQSYCLRKEYEQAISVLSEFLTQRPDNPLAIAETGFAFGALAMLETDQQIAQTYQSKSLQYLEKVGFSAKAFINRADLLFKQERYRDALLWYALGDSYVEQQNSFLFRDALLRLLLQGSNPYTNQINDEMIFRLDADLTIKPSDLFIFSSGSPVKTRVEADREIGVLYSNSQDAGILLDVSEIGEFCISVQTVDKPPAPTQMAVDVDFDTIKVLDLVNGNGDWVQFSFNVELDQGLHVLGIKLMNDAIVEGSDRNAYFGSITISTCD